MTRQLAVTRLFNTVALFVATWLLSGLSYGSEWWALLIAGLVSSRSSTSSSSPCAPDAKPIAPNKLRCLAERFSGQRNAGRARAAQRTPQST
jgi:hypothetical protein